MGKINNLVQHLAAIKTYHHTVPQSSLDIDVVLGSPSKDCEGHGICYVSKRNQANRSGCSLVKATVHFTVAGTVQFQFLKSDLKASHPAKYFRNGVFLVEEIFHLPDFILEWMQRVYAVVSPGIYPVQETADRLIVEFEL